MTAHESCGCAEYQELSRRRFMALTGSAAAVVATAPAWLPRVALAKDHRGAQRDVVISLFLRGAADGLSLVVPHGDNSYYANRPTQAVPRPGTGTGNDAIDLDGFFGIPPMLMPLMTAYQNGHLLFVHAAGSTDPSRSHFDAQRFMEVGLARAPAVNTGWLGRHLYSAAPTDPNALLRAVGISTGLQQTLAGGPLTLPIPNLDNFGLSGTAGTVAAREAALGDMYAVVPDPLHAAAQTTIDTIALLNQIDFANYMPAGGAVYPGGGFGVALKSSAALIKAQVGVEAIAMDVSGWDTHNTQGTLTGTMAGLMTTLASGLAALYADLTAGTGHSFTVVVMTEFGRRLLENASQGTDHGHGGAMIVLGQCVAGGRVLTQWPGLAPDQLFEGRDLQVTIDYRDVLAEVVERRLGNADLSYVFPSFKPTFRGVTAC